MNDIRDFLRSLPHHRSPGTDWLGSPQQYPWYERVFGALRPYTIFELGTFLGYSLSVAAATLKNLHCVRWVDNESYLPGSNALAAENIVEARKRADLKPITLQYDTTRPDMDEYDTPPWDLVHIDGDHSFEGCLADLRYALGLNPGVIIGHDYLLEPGVKQAVIKACDDARISHFVLNDFTHGLFVIPLVGHANVLVALWHASVGTITIVPPGGGL